MPCGVEVKSEQIKSLVFCRRWRVTSVRSLFHHSGAKTFKSCGFTEWALFALSDGGNN